MPTIASVITRNVVVVRPDETLQRAAELMSRLDVGGQAVEGRLRVGLGGRGRAPAHRPAAALHPRHLTAL